MKSTFHLSLILILLFSQTTVWSQKTVDDWQKKAVTEFPDIGVKDSELNLKYIRAVQSLRVSNPSFFNDPKWPYAIAIQVTKKSVIPGLENVPPPRVNIPHATNQDVTPNTRRVYNASGNQINVEVVTSENVSTDGVTGQMINVEGVITKTFEPSLSASDRFYVQLQPNVFCEFMIAPFFIRSDHGLGSLRSLSGGSLSYYRDSMKLHFEGGAIFVYETRDFGYYRSQQKKTTKLGEILKPGEKVIINGRYEGNGSVGVTKGKMLRDCSVVNR